MFCIAAFLVLTLVKGDCDGGAMNVTLSMPFPWLQFGKFTVSITSELDFDFQDIADLQASSATFDSPMNPHH